MDESAPAGNLRPANWSLRDVWAFLRWLLSGPDLPPRPRMIVLAASLWLLAGIPGPGRYGAATLHGPARSVSVAAGVAVLVMLALYWAAQVRRDEPRRIRSRWDRRRG